MECCNCPNPNCTIPLECYFQKSREALLLLSLENGNQAFDDIMNLIIQKTIFIRKVVYLATTYGYTDYSLTIDCRFKLDSFPKFQRLQLRDFMTFGPFQFYHKFHSLFSTWDKCIDKIINSK